MAIFPASLSDDGSDFNDLHQAAGLQAVSCIVKPAIDAHQASQLAQQPMQTDKPTKGRKRAPNKPCGDPGDDGRTK